MRLPWLLMFAVPTAFGADHVVNRIMEINDRFWFAWLVIQFLCMMGWAGSSLPKLAGWPDGSLAARLAIMQGVIVAAIAGNTAYFIGYYLMDSIPEVMCFIATIVAAWGGDKFLSPLLDRVSSIITNVIGKNSGGGT